MTRFQYFEMCEQMGIDPRPEEIPPDVRELSLEAQHALLLFNILPDKIDGMAGVWLGKDYTGIMDVMDIYKIEEHQKVEVFDYLRIIISIAAEHYGKQKELRDNR